ncbi:MAG: hypothetical protein NZ899_11045 [Thermoguttaceae bacterium]|nr:hypothetical protein [Thermoguttaceae bacterium]MDW8079140.1 hypothetical protein [Thermoguttaceae bacterium]
MGRKGRAGGILALGAATSVGILLGFVLGGLMPSIPVQAVATDRAENYAIATGWVDEGVEALYFLDFLTGTLRAAVPSNQTRDFRARFETNVLGDLQKVIDLQNANLAQVNAQRARAGQPPLPPLQMPQNPRFLMVTGNLDIRRGAAARTRPSAAAVYVAELNTGIVLAYVVPWNQSAHAANQPQGGSLELWASDRFATAIIRTQ